MLEAINKIKWSTTINYVTKTCTYVTRLKFDYCKKVLWNKIKGVKNDGLKINSINLLADNHILP
jgi:hypothetical protein